VIRSAWNTRSIRPRSEGQRSCRNDTNVSQIVDRGLDGNNDEGEKETLR
jgi:hypothetical protein